MNTGSASNDVSSKRAAVPLSCQRLLIFAPRSWLPTTMRVFRHSRRSTQLNCFESANPSSLVQGEAVLIPGSSMSNSKAPARYRFLPSTQPVKLRDSERHLAHRTLGDRAAWRTRLAHGAPRKLRILLKLSPDLRNTFVARLLNYASNADARLAHLPCYGDRPVSTSKLARQSANHSASSAAAAVR